MLRRVFILKKRLFVVLFGILVTTGGFALNEATATKAAADTLEPTPAIMQPDGIKIGG